VEHKDEIEEICESADKQLNIEIKLKEINDRWDTEKFIFSGGLKSVMSSFNHVANTSLTLQNGKTAESLFFKGCWLSLKSWRSLKCNYRLF
jgi:hypothetical protein